MKTVPGGVTLDSRGRPTDANGNPLEGLPDRLTDEQREACREAGLVAQKQVEFHSAGVLSERFGLSDEIVQALTQPEDLFSDGDEVQATDAAEELAAEHDVDLADVEATGKNGKVLKSDVEDALTE